MSIEICRLEMVRESKRSWIFWWEERQPTLQGEQVIYKGPECIDEFSRARQSMLSIIADVYFGNDEKSSVQLEKLAEQMRADNTFVVGQLAAQGWEPMSTDDKGLVSLMKRGKSQVGRLRRL